jgi:membrane associated rhomboid family serine protease
MRRPSNPLALNSAVQYLLVVTLVVYALQIWFQVQAGRFLGFNIGVGWFEKAFGLIPACLTYSGSGFNPFLENLCLVGYQVWQPFTYMFLHGGLWHIGFNMLALWMFGNVLEHVWGMRRFLNYYLFCGIGAGVTVALVAFLTGDGLYGVTIGASGSILGLLLAFGMLFPNQIIYLYFFPVKAKYAVWIFGALSLYFAFSGALAGISHIGHLGGLLFGLIAMKGRGWWARLSRR